MTELLPRYKTCFFCGPATGGLALKLQYGEGKAFTEFTAREEFQGYDGMLHGGIVTGILDEVMWWALFMEKRTISATSKIEVEFLRPVVCGKPYRASGEFVDSSRGIYRLSAAITDGSGRIAARAQGAFRRIRGSVLKDVITYLDFRGVSPEVRALFDLPGP